MADAGKFNIAITGDSSSFRSELAKTVTSAKTAAGQISGAFRGVQGVLAGLGVGISIAGFTDFVKTTIDALDRLGELSEIAGISATKLGGLAFAAKSSGVEIEQLSKGIKALNIELAKAQAGDQASQELFRKLGVDPNKVKSADDALLKIADSFATYADGAGKAQLATAAFGKAGAELIPLLNQGGDQLRQQIAYYEKYSGVTDDLVAKSNEFNDTLDKLHLLTGAFGKTLVAQLLPSLQGLVNLMVESKEKGDGFNDTATTMVDILKLLASWAGWATYKFGDLGNSIGHTAAQMNALIHFDFKGMKAIWDARMEFVADLNKREQAFQDALAGKKAAPGLPKPKGLPPAPVLGGVAGAGRMKTEVDEFGKQMQRVREMAAEAGAELREAFSGEKLTGGMKALEKLMASDAWAKFTEAQQAQLKGAYEQVSALEKETDAWKKKREEQEKQIKLYQDIQAAEEKARVAGTAALGDFAEKNDEFEKHIKIIGKGQKAYDLLNAEIEQNKRIQANIGADQATIELMNQQYERQKKLIEAYHDATEAQRIFAEEAKAMQEVKNMISDSFANAFTDFITGTKSAKDAFKSFANDITQQLARMAAKNIANALFGGNTGSGPDFFSLFGKLATAWIGGGAGTGAGQGYGTIGSNIPPGPYPYAMGTPYVPSTRLAIVHKGEAIIPAKYNRSGAGGGLTIVQNINVASGADSATLRQSAKRAFGLAASQMREGLMAYRSDLQLPTGVDLDWVSGSGYFTRILRTESGRESRNQEWDQTLAHYVMRYNARKYADWVVIADMFDAAAGMAHSWPLRDPRHNNATAAQGKFEAIDATHWYMVVRKTFASYTFDRRVKPAASPTIVGGSGSYSFTTGIFTGSSMPTSWAGDYFICVRFDTDELEVTGVNRSADGTLIAGFKDVPIAEVRDE